MKVLGVEVPPAQVEKEPVLDVPAIDMTDDATPEPVAKATRPTLSSKAEASKPKIGRSPADRSVRSETAAKRPSPRGAKVAAPRHTRDGSVGRDTFEAVEALVKQGKSKTEAFAQIASDTGRNTGTVSASYYRVSRVNGAAKPRRRGRASTKAPSGTPRMKTTTKVRGGTSDIDRLAADLVKSVTALADAVRSQEAEVATLRSRLDGVREAVGA